MTELLAFVARPGENLGRHWRLGRITEGRGQIVDWAVSLTTDHPGRGHLVVVESSGCWETVSPVNNICRSAVGRLPVSASASVAVAGTTSVKAAIKSPLGSARVPPFPLGVSNFLGFSNNKQSVSFRTTEFIGKNLLGVR